MQHKGTLILLALIAACTGLIISGHRDAGSWFGLMGIAWAMLGGLDDD
jgi:hypothetical protein